MTINDYSALAQRRCPYSSSKNLKRCSSFPKLSIALASIVLLNGSSSSVAFAIVGPGRANNGNPEQLQRTTKNIDHGELPADFPRRNDVLVALDAVRQACAITRALQPTLVVQADDASNSKSSSDKITTINKADLSPVTIADYAVQALILHQLRAQFPDDGFIAEEDSQTLRSDEGLCQQVVSAIADNCGVALAPEETLQGIDLGKSYTAWDDTANEEDDTNSDDSSDTVTGSSSRIRPRRVWCLDPIDGTKGFLRGKKNGGQYCVALALVDGGVPTVGILGCPNLPVGVHDDQFGWSDHETDETNTETRGCIFVASRGGGCYQLPLTPSSDRKVIGPLSVTPNDASTRSIQKGRFCIGVEKFSDALGQTNAMAQILHGALSSENGEILYAKRMDSQAKHGVIARSGAEWYVRLPKPGYQEFIWDHAAGNVVIEEAGGTMTDTTGQPLDFSLGPKLSVQVSGILMSNGGVFHTALVDAFAKQEEARLAGGKDGSK